MQANADTHINKTKFFCVYIYIYNCYKIKLFFYIKVAGWSPMHELAIFLHFFTLELIDQINYFTDIQRFEHI